MQIDPLHAEQHVEALLQANRQALAADGEAPPRSVGIIGAGMMGTAIAAVHVAAGIPVAITDLEPAAVERAADRVADELRDREGAGGAEAATARLLTPTADLAAVAGCELVLESIVEQLGPKLDLYRQIDPWRAPGGVLATNTSTLPLRKLAAGLRRPEDLCGMHFFHPVRRRALVEVIRGPQSSAAAIGRTVACVREVGKTPVLVGDGPGFLVNRLLQSWAAEALRMLQEGIEAEAIDRAAIEFGMARGPLALLDEIGLETALRGGVVLYEAYPERIEPSPVLLTLIKGGRLGVKAGAGFFGYQSQADGSVVRQSDPALRPLLARWEIPPAPVEPADWGLRMIVPMLLEAARVLDEGLVRSPSEVDLGALFGLGFPRSKGGLLYWADAFGPRRLRELLKRMEPLGARMAPPESLRRMLEAQGRFYR